MEPFPLIENPITQSITQSLMDTLVIRNKFPERSLEIVNRNGGYVAVLNIRFYSGRRRLRTRIMNAIKHCVSRATRVSQMVAIRTPSLASWLCQDSSFYLDLSINYWSNHKNNGILMRLIMLRKKLVFAAAVTRHNPRWLLGLLKGRVCLSIRY